MSSTDRVADAAIGHRIRAARLERSIGLRTLAARLLISPTTLSHLETGKVRLSVVRLTEIADALGTTPAVILDSGAGLTHADPGAGDTRADWRRFDPLDLDPVLSAALAEFGHVGYHGASVRNIAKRVGLSVSGLYHYHPSKQAILHALLLRTVEDMLWRTRAARAQGHDPVERFALIIECLALFHTHRRAAAFVGISEMRSLEPDNLHQITELRRIQQHMVDEEVAASVATGRFTTTAPEEAAIAAVTMCLSLAQWYRPGGTSAPEDIAAHHVRFALDLMRPAD